jgi:hypothetical protein
MSEQEKERHGKDTDGSTEEPDVEAHLQDTFAREDAFQEKGLQDTADERHRLDEAL